MSQPASQQPASQEPAAKPGEGEISAAQTTPPTEGQQAAGEQAQGEGASPSEELKAAVEGAKAPEPKTPAAPAAKDWRDSRIAKQSDKIRQLTAELAARQGQAKQAAGESGEDFEARVNAEAERRAAFIARTTDFNKRSMEAQLAGEAAYGKDEFNRSVQGLAALRDPSDAESVKAHQQLIVAALETGEAPKLVHMLGQDPNEAARIMALEPVQMGIALAKLAAKDAPKVTQAPEPIEPLGAKGKARLEINPADKDKSDDLSTATWMERRNAEIKAGKSRARA